MTPRNVCEACGGPLFEGEAHEHLWAAGRPRTVDEVMKDLDASIAEQRASLDKQKVQRAKAEAKVRPLLEAALKERVRAEAEESARIHGAKKP